MQVGVRELKLHLGRYLAQVREGETIQVTDRGKVVACLTPVPEEHLPPRLEKLLREGGATYHAAPLHLPHAVKMSAGDKTGVDYVRDQRR